jgi:DNA-binding NarL/FixJ family response regulator
MRRQTFVLALASPVHVADALAAARDAGLRVVDGWAGAEGDVCAGSVTQPEDAARALLAAVAGASLVVSLDAGDELTDRLCDDLRRLGPVEVFSPDTPRRRRLTNEQGNLLRLLSDGLTLGAAAAELGLSRRTADRRLAAARQALGVESTAEAIVAFSRSRA